MSYTPTTWVNGDTITAAGLNKIEQGIADSALPSAPTQSGTYSLQNTVSSGSGALAWGLSPYEVIISVSVIVEDNTPTIGSYAILKGDYATAKAILDNGGLCAIFVQEYGNNVDMNHQVNAAGFMPAILNEGENEIWITDPFFGYYMIWTSSGIVIGE